jgi:hypothetical protein
MTYVRDIVASDGLKNSLEICWDNTKAKEIGIFNKLRKVTRHNLHR